MENEKKKRGRPEGYRVDEPASKTLAGVRVTDRQLKAYKAASEREQKTFSAWVREVLDRASNKMSG